MVIVLNGFPPVFYFAQYICEEVLIIVLSEVFEVLTEVQMKSHFSRNVTSCRLVSIYQPT